MKPFQPDPNDNPNPVMRCDAAGEVTYANRAAQDIFQSWQHQNAWVMPDSLMAAIQESLQQRHTVTTEVIVGKQVYLMQCVPTTDQSLINLYGFNITPRKKLQRQAKQLAEQDALTGLANRQRLLTYITDQLVSAQQLQHKFAVLMVDIADFKNVNAVYGPKMGDKLLREVAGRLAECVPGDYPIARLADDEFAIVCPNVEEQALLINLSQVIHDFLSQPYVLDQQDIEVDCHIGIVVCPDDAKDVAGIISHVAIATNRAQQEHQVYAFYQHQMGDAVKAKRSLLKDLRYAIERAQLQLYYQPQVKLPECKIIGAEALLRWQHPEYGLVSPARFMPIAEEHGLIVAIGEWVLRRASEQMWQWHQQGFDQLRLSVNVASLQFEQADFVPMVKQVLSDTQLPAHSLELEMTETTLIKNLELAKMRVAKLREMEVQIAIDDFGTGYSSLEYLKTFPADRLKIDRTFIADLEHSEANRSIVDAVISLGHSLGMKVMAEGIESEQHRDLLILQGCDEGQGYLFSEPVAASEFKELIKQ